MSLSFEERKVLLLEMLQLQGKIKVTDAEKMLKVSGETIRRDMDRLEKEGFLTRVYGGAITSKDKIEKTFHQKQLMNIEEKRSICKKAASLIEEGDVIFIGHGTTAYELLNYVTVKNVTVITNSFPIVNLFGNAFKGNFIFLGGEYNQRQEFSSGPFALQMLEQLRADKAFVPAGGITKKDGITDYDIPGAMICRKMIERADNTILIADNSKIGVSSFVKICNVQDISIMVTDSPCSTQWNEYLRVNNIELLIAD
ncbi:DeoR/GlpR family DNA-binding transcription regulator [Rummeliibacillus sp. SL167]|uniref:DeoR/GlpR family DNA-binding transcription regulator n=1 Tax=Rummeliibacillus sp. SL167 TaxID=2579792 RepID=UPI0011B6688E|nr:DeoR/GlpR family DNA-binding transcription regulator [Rummeliibacillus sp. SL167]